MAERQLADDGCYVGTGEISKVGQVASGVHTAELNHSSAAFVILTWNSLKYINDCLDSVLKLPYRRLDVFVVDNGSSDGTVQALEDYSARFENLHCIYLDSNKGTTYSRNLALQQITSDTDYVCILDSDTVVNNSAFEELSGVLARDSSGIGLIAPNLVGKDGKGQLNGRNLPSLAIKILKAVPIAALNKRGAALEEPPNNRHDGLLDVGYLISACWYMPYSTLEKVGLLDEKIFYAPEDVDYCVRVHKAALRVVQYDRTHIVHDYQRLSHKKLFSKTNVRHIAGLAYYFKKYGYLNNPYKAFSSREV